MGRRRLGEQFAALRERGAIGLLPFVPAGFPDLSVLGGVLAGLERGGATAVEIGIPFSDPIADGPTIQEAFNVALAKRIKVAEVFAAVAAARARVSIPLLAMVSYSIVFRFGQERFFREAKAAGFDAMIIPDLPPPEAQGVCEKMRAEGLDTVLLISPTTAERRRAEIARLCSGFAYYLSVSGITGERERLPEGLAENVRRLRRETDVPVCVGFGISKAEHVRQLRGVADGAIVGSAFVKRMRENPGREAQAVEGYARALLEG